MIIGITGRQQTGKDTAATIITKICGWRNISMRRYAFAQPLKQLCASLLHMPVDALDHAEVKGSMLPEHLHSTFGKITVRQLLQLVGTDTLKRHLSYDFFMLCVPKECYSNTIFTDVRFHDEALWLRQRGGHIIRMQRDTGIHDDHSSEIQAFPADTTIDNNGSMDSLIAQLTHTIDILTKH